MAALGVRAFDFDHPLPYICQCRASCLLFCCALIIPPEPTASFCAARSESVSQGERKKNSLRTDHFSTIGPVVCVCTSAEENIIPAVPWQKPNRSDPCCFDGIPAWIPAFSGLPGHGSRENYSSSALCPGTLPGQRQPCRLVVVPAVVKVDGARHHAALSKAHTARRGAALRSL